MTTTNTDWQQVVVNLEIQLEVHGYDYGIWHDLVVARSTLAKQQTERG